MNPFTAPLQLLALMKPDVGALAPSDVVFRENTPSTAKWAARVFAPRHFGLLQIFRLLALAKSQCEHGFLAGQRVMLRKDVATGTFGFNLAEPRPVREPAEHARHTYGSVELCLPTPRHTVLASLLSMVFMTAGGTLSFLPEALLLTNSFRR